MDTDNRYPVCLVKGSHVVYVVGYNMGGYSPDPDHLTVCATLDDARLIMADMIDRFIDQESESLEDWEVEEYQTAENESAWLWEGHGYADAMREMVLPNSRSWGEVGDDSGTSVTLEDTRGYGQTYWIDRSTIAEAFGPTWHDDIMGRNGYVPDELAYLIDEISA